MMTRLYAEVKVTSADLLVYILSYLNDHVQTDQLSYIGTLVG